MVTVLILIVIIMNIRSLDWAISSTAIAIFLAVLCIVLFVCSLTLLKLCYVGTNRDSSITIINFADFNYWIIILLFHWQRMQRKK